MGKMLRNRAQCLDCMEIIESFSRHDFKTCQCWSENAGIFVDGGINGMPRYGFHDITKFRNLSEYEKDL